MSRWIRPKYNEQCKENTSCSKNAVLIDSRKVPEGYWLELLREKCPEGLGETSESLKNNKDLVAEDFLDDEEAFLCNKETTDQCLELDEQNESITETARVLSGQNDEIEKTVVLSGILDDQKDGDKPEHYGFKTPVLPKHNSVCSINVTPCLFSPDLLSQPTQEVTPKRENVMDTTPGEKELLELIASPTLSQFPCVENSPENAYQTSPDILALMVAERRPRSSLALLSAAGPDDDIDGWSDSMATPPVQWSQQLEEAEEDIEVHKKSSDKHVVRTLFKGANKDTSSEISGFSVLDSCEDENDTASKTLLLEEEETCIKTNDVVELGKILDLETSAKDCSLLKMIKETEKDSLHLSQVDELVSSDVLRKERSPEFVQERRCSCKKKCSCLVQRSAIQVQENKVEGDTECSGISQSLSPLLSQTTSLPRFPPAATGSSPSLYTQEVQKLLDLAQSTPKIPGNKAVENGYQMRKTGKHSVEYNYGRNINNNKDIIADSYKKFKLNEVLEDSSTREEDFSEATDISSSFPKGNKNNVDFSQIFKPDSKSEVSFEMPVTPKLSSLFPVEDDMLSKPCYGGGVSGVSSEMPKIRKLSSSSCPVEGDMPLKPHYGGEVNDVTFGSISTSLEEAMVEEAEKFLTKKIEVTPDKETEMQLPNGDERENLKNPKNINSAKLEKLNTGAKKSRMEQGSACKVLGVRRSSRSKRFSYPISRQSFKSKDSVESIIKISEGDAQTCDVSKDILNNECQDCRFGVAGVQLENKAELGKENKKKWIEKSKSQRDESEKTCYLNEQSNQDNKEQREMEDKRSGWKENENKSQKKVHLDISQDNPGSNADSNNLIPEACEDTKQTEEQLLTFAPDGKNSIPKNIENINKESYHKPIFAPDGKNSTSKNNENMDKEFHNESMSAIFAPDGKNSTTKNNENMDKEFHNEPMSAIFAPDGKNSTLRSIKNIDQDPCYEAIPVDIEDCINEDITDNTLIAIQEDFKNPSKITCIDALYDMDGLSQFPVELLTQTQTDGYRYCKQTFYNESSYCKEDYHIARNSNPVLVSGFKTASGKDVSISEESLEKAKTMFEIENRGSIKQKSDGEKVTNTKTSTMSGFKTAGGKDVSISEEAKRKARAMFEMENRDSIEQQCNLRPKANNIKPSTMSGFKAAGEKDVTIPEEALKKAKTVFEMENRESKEQKNDVIPNINNTKTSILSGLMTAGGEGVSISEKTPKEAKVMFEMEYKECDKQQSDVRPNASNSKPSKISGFTTAGGKDVNISEKALKKAKTMFEMENRESIEQKYDDEKVSNVKQSMMSGFKTAGGKDVNISEEALKKAKVMFKMENRESIEQKSDGVKVSNVKQSMMSGFKTAGGKDVNISEEALKKAKVMFEVENRESIEQKSDDVKVSNVKQSMMSAFKTAGGKDVNISEEALKKAKVMFEVENRESIEQKTDDIKVSNVKPSMMSGFKTAGGKDVNISEEALKKAKVMFEVENREGIEQKSDDVKVSNVKQSMMSAFKTAGGKDVNISEEALKKAKVMFEMENRESIEQKTDDVKVSNVKPSMMSGFKTAGGKDVNISEEAMKKAKVMFEMENRESIEQKSEEVKVSNVKQSMMSGFKTAGGKDVNISEEALKKAKVMFKMENRESIEQKSDGVNVSNVKPSMMSGFKTAGGKDVNISEEALKKAKVMFEVENRESDRTQSNSIIETSKHNNIKETTDVTNEQNEPVAKARRPEEINRSALIRQGPETSCVVATSSMDGVNRKQQDQEVPLFKVLTPSPRESAVLPLQCTSSNKDLSTAKSSQSFLPNRRTSIVYSTPIHEVDENLSREILESSAALIADESFTGFSEYNPIQDERFTVPRGCTSDDRKNVSAGSSGDICQSEHRLSKREAMMVHARRRSAPFLSSEDRSSQSLQTRSNIMPIKSSPGVLYDRRSKMFSPPLKPIVVSPNMSTPISSFPPARKESKRLFVRQGSPLNPSTTCPSQTSPLVTEGRQSSNERPNSTTNTGIPKKQFTTPYRSSAPPLSSVSSAQNEKHDDGSPDRKRARILGPLGQATKKTGTKSDTVGRESVKPRMGYLYQLRQNSTRINLKKYVEDASPQCYTKQQLFDLCVSDDVMAVTSNNAESFRFTASRFFSKDTVATNSGIRTDDGGLVFIGEDGRIGLEEIEKALSITPGVDVKLIPHGWIANHYKWIVWKLASMEMAFPHLFAARCLTPDWVLCQLKYRYDREIDRSHRSALKKVLERDDLSSRTMVLCVSSVTPTKRQTDGQPDQPSNHEASTVIELTDGWYSVNTLLDAPLTNLLSKGKVFVGLKLCISGAELIGSDQAVSPLEAPSSLRLRITANSTRRARWNTRLGFHSYTHPFPLPLSSLFCNGGVVGCVDVVVLRRYPVEYMEKLASGTAVFRNSRAEEREAKKFGQDLELAREAVFAKVQREFEETSNKSDTRSCKKARSYSPKDIAKLRRGKELYEAYSSTSDPSFIEECLDNNQRSSLEEYRRSLQDSKRAELESMFQRAWHENEQNVSKRTVVPMLKVRLVNYYKCSQDRTEAILSIWRPNEDVVQMLTEGSRLRIYHVMASGSRYRQGLPSLQLSTTRSTRYKTMDINHNIVDDLYSTRKTTSFEELQTNPPALYSEVDLVGVIIFITSHNSSSLQTVYLSDEDHYLVSVKFWGGLKTFALDDLVRPRCVVACSNLVVRSSEHANCPTLAFNELSTLTFKPREAYLRTALDYLNDNIQDMGMLMDVAQGSLDRMRRPESALRMNSTRVSDSPIKDKIKKCLKTEKDNSKNIEGTSPRQCDSTSGSSLIARELVPSPVNRPLSGQCKRKLLENTPEPPVTPSINVTVSDSVRRDFKRPRRLATGSPQ